MLRGKLLARDPDRRSQITVTCQKHDRIALVTPTEVQELHRDRPPEHLVVPAPHHRHPAGAEPLDEPVPASNRVHNVISVPYPDNGSVSATPERQV